MVDHKKLLTSSVNEMKKIGAIGDTEIGHNEADNLLCDILEELGFKRLVDEWEKIDKWYA